ncbi:hypothetical protein Pmani_005168 [Petrolisthes manimaculis]|uniref:Regulatory protein zeste n=1 Tax=Petrolisthes manimaculis TaxID=1843537 RepID=A0AAE1QC78_9EUCA|nr:hypothetical protein Pmani_005168 [Petrolisthes manimaculis]
MIFKKNTAWTEVTTIFNAGGYGPQRSQQQLKKIWENSKGKAKKDHAAYKREVMRTGGGTPPKKEDDETAKVLGIISGKLDDLGNDFDCGTRQMRVNSENGHSVVFSSIQRCY